MVLQISKYSLYFPAAYLSIMLPCRYVMSSIYDDYPLIVVQSEISQKQMGSHRSYTLNFSPTKGVGRLSKAKFQKCKRSMR